MRFSLPRPHQLARTNYRPRYLSFAAIFAVCLLMAWEGQIGWSVIPVAALQFLAYPHLVYLRACLARDSKRAERQHLLLDSLLLGAWTAEFQFKWWLLFAFFASVCVNNSVVRGVRGGLSAAGFFVLGCLGWGAVRGFQFQPETSQTVMLTCMVCLVLYFFQVALLAHEKNLLLMQRQQEVQQRNLVFQSLLALSMEMRQAASVDQLCSIFLDHLRNLFPQAGLAILLRERHRPENIRHAAFLQLHQDRQDWLLSELRRRPQARELIRPDSEDSYALLPIQGNLKQLEGRCIIHSARLNPNSRETLSLFLEQFAAALENQLLTAQLQHMANTDPLTGVFNRARLEQEWQRLARIKAECPSLDFSALVIDLNGLKGVNDQYGHESGDQLIQALALLLRENCRESDLLFRLGGDEFLVLCPSTDRQAASQLAKRLRVAARKAYAVCSPDRNSLIKIPLRMSIGLASSSECAPDMVIKLADDRMYQRKRAYYRSLGRDEHPFAQASDG